MNIRTKCLALLGLFLFAGSAMAEMREFTSAYGQKMKFELVSHDGSGTTVDLKTEAGAIKKGMKITAFSAEDQAYITAWMKKTPATINYSFRYTIKKKRLGGVNNGSSVGTSREAQWAYDVEIVNASRQTVRNLLVRYQIHKTARTKRYYSSTRVEKSHSEGEVLVEKETKLNGAIRFQTKEVTLETEDSDYYYDDKRDSLAGLHVRIFDEHGRMVDEWRSEGVDKQVWVGDKKENGRQVIRN